MSDIAADLELATNQELIDELLRRSTFAGIVIACAGGEVKTCIGVGRKVDLMVSWRNMTREQAAVNMHDAIARVASGEGKDL